MLEVLPEAIAIILVILFVAGGVAICLGGSPLKYPEPPPPNPDAMLPGSVVRFKSKLDMQRYIYETEAKRRRELDIT
jgi:hypothetical protein